MQASSLCCPDGKYDILVWWYRPCPGTLEATHQEVKLIGPRTYVKSTVVFIRMGARRARDKL